MFLNRAVLPFVSFVRGWVVATTLLSLVASVLSLAVAFTLAAAVTRIMTSFTGEPGQGSVTTALVATGALALLRGGCLWARDQLAMITATRIKAAVRARLIGKIHELGPGYAWPTGRGSIQANAVEGVEHLQSYVGFYLPQLVVSWLVPAAGVVVLLFVSWPVAILVVGCIVMIPLSRRLWRFVLRRRALDHWEQYGAYASRLTDTIRGLPTLVALGATARRRRQLADAAERLRLATTANMRASLGVSAVMTAAMTVGTAGATLLAAFQATQGTLELGEVLLVLFLAAECFRPQQELAGYWHEGFYGIAAADGVATVLATQPPVVEAADVRKVQLSRLPDVELRGVSFRYPGTKRDVLADVSFQVPGGSTVAIVGASGAGKTTLGKLLLRDLDPDAGEIRLDEHLLNEFPLAQLREVTARVAQDVVLLSGTVRENIEAAWDGDDPAQVERAIAAARVDEMACDLPDGLDSQVGESGRLLSGGQRQRVALARAIVSGASVLLLDEATSALDAENEALITAVLREQRGTRTTFVIAHRLSTVAHADYVVVLDGGRVAEFGPTAELASAGGRWAALLDAQRDELAVLASNQGVGA